MFELFEIALSVSSDSLHYFVAGIFIVAAFHKLADTKHFNQVLGSYEILPSRILPFISPVLPIVELMVALSLCLDVWFGWFDGISNVLAFALLVAYTSALAKVYFEGRALEDCGCGGSANQPIGPWPLFRNAILIGLCASLSLTQEQDFNQVITSDSIFYSIQAIVLAAALSLIYWASEELHKNKTLILLLEKRYD